MDCTYDEDLDENVFFQILKNEYIELFQKATLEGWIICIPRAGSMPRYSLSYNDFFNHILIPSDELPETHFRTLNDKEVRICNKVISVENADLSVPFSIHILFEETYYTDDLMKYKVLCIDTPMSQPPDGIKAESGIVNVNTLRDCVDLLWTEGSKEVLERMDDIIQTFLISNDELEFQTLQNQKDLVGSLYINCLQTALKDPRLRDKTGMNRHLLDNVKISVESYILHGIYKKLIKGITRCTAAEDASFNKITRNLADIQLRDLDISTDFQDVIPKARRELVKVEGYSTVVGKVGCLKQTISAISNNLDSSYGKSNVVAADELLPLLVFLILKSSLPNWIAHLTYIKEFSYSSSEYHANQHSFLVTSLEAAIEHVRGGIVIGPSEPESQIDHDLGDNIEEDIVSLKNEIRGTSLIEVFEMAKCGDIKHLEKVLNHKESKKLGSLDGLNLCHPLCSCDNCERKLSIYLCNVAPTINSCDDRGLTVLHISAIYGQPKVADLLLRLEANPNKSDYKGSTPLHYAAGRGHQNIVLLLLQSGAKIDQADNEGNTPLHLAANNGHETCVKAILCYAEYMEITLNVNFANNVGDTPLHYASRWGYESIVGLLLEYGAIPSIENKRKLTPIDNAHNMIISNMLTGASKKLQDIPLKSPTNDVQVAAASKVHLDFIENDTENNNACRKRSTFGIKPKTTEEIKNVERILRAITYGDTRLACFYLGIEPNSLKHYHKSCHPLCPCKNKIENDDVLGDSKIEKPLNVNVCDSNGFTPLHISSLCGRVELCMLLIEAGANVNIQSRISKMTALHMACQNSHVAVVKVLLETGSCDINLQDSQGNSALHFACQASNLNLVECLLEYKPIVNVSNSENKTPLDEATDAMSLSIVQLLSRFTEAT